MSDRRIVERLREWPLSEKLALEAADRIEALEAALREIADHWAPSVNEWAMKFKGIASKALEGK